MQKVNGKYPVRIENCIDCGNEFIIVLEEFIQKKGCGPGRKAGGSDGFQADITE